jgi:hypothetical protein
MSSLFSSAWWILPLGLVAFFLYDRVSWSTRTSRRRRRSYYKVATKAKRPTVTFMVHTR